MRRSQLEKLEEFDNHELVAFLYDADTGLRGYVAIHNTRLGPATGGTRYWHYSSAQDALCDALRLSRAMTYKCALAGVPYGGGKGVIIGSSRGKKRKEILRAYARKINLFGGSFTTGEDVGLTEEDIDVMSAASSFINCKKELGGDPGPWAALGVWYAMRAALKALYGKPTFENRNFAIKGLGSVGMELCRLIHSAGGTVFAADVDIKKTGQAKKEFSNIKIISVASIHKMRVDVYAPCALGGELTRKRIGELRCSVVCGAANNQLAYGESGMLLYKKGILYVPDYVANAGGLINVSEEMRLDGYDKDRVEKKVRKISSSAKKIIELSFYKKRPTNEIADWLAEKKIYV